MVAAKILPHTVNLIGGMLFLLLVQPEEPHLASSMFFCFLRFAQWGGGAEIGEDPPVNHLQKQKLFRFGLLF